MNLPKILLLLSISVYFCGCGVFQSTSEYSYIDTELNRGSISSSNNEGKCYAKCLIEKSTIIYSADKYAVYTGNEEEEDVDISIVKVELKPRFTKWLKKRADGDCHAPNPEDCMVWCLVHKPAITEEVKVLQDTSQSTNYEYRAISYKHVPEPGGGHTEWRQVLCEEDLTSAIITDLQKALTDLGYFNSSETYEFDSETKKALIAFQRELELPIGNLNFETLDVLGILVD